ncbi:MAG: CoA transferase, partial [Myxococcota bacterium]
MSSPEGSALEGIRVLEVSDGSAGYCGKLLADLGADVIKIEPPGGDPSRLEPPFAGATAGPDRGLGFLYVNANKRSVVLDLSEESDRGRFHRLAGSAALIVESLPPGQLDSWDLGFESLRA